MKTGQKSRICSPPTHPSHTHTALYAPTIRPHVYIPPTPPHPTPPTTTTHTFAQLLAWCPPLQFNNNLDKGFGAVKRSATCVK
jgi:hypothetical protein